VKCIKDEEDKVLVHKKDIKDTWKKYFQSYLMKEMRSHETLISWILERRTKL